MNPENLIPKIDFEKVFRRLVRELLENLEDIMNESIKQIVDAIHKMSEKTNEHFASLLSDLQISCHYQEIMTVQEFPNPPDPKNKSHKIFEDGCFSRPITREELLMILSILVVLIGAFL